MEVKDLNALFDELFPICRSITGQGFRDSLNLLRQYIPLEVKSVSSGTQVYDWEVPAEWVIREARLTGADGKTYASLEDSSLAVINCSAPVDNKISLSELKPHLHTLPHLPNAIPYVTSYYKRDWGFCLPYRVFQSMPDIEYHAYIDSEFIEGELNYGELLLHGESDREILLTSYLCHPSLANNELSGPLVLTLLYQKLSEWERRRYSYRFLINPETIGSIVYLSLNGNHLMEKMVSGLVLTCLGGPSTRLSYKTTRRKDALIDQVIAHLNKTNSLKIDVREFTPLSGSDERQYCSPGFNLPMGQMARTVYGQYEGYHNSLDNKEFMGIDSLFKSADEIEQILFALEYAGSFFNLLPYGEPRLGKRDLYPNMNNYMTREYSSDDIVDNRTLLNYVLMILNYSDGEHPMTWIAEKCDCSIFDLIPIINELKAKGVLSIEGDPRA